MSSLAERYDDTPLGEPLLREWELQSNSTRWEYFVAAPSDSTLIQMWWGLGSVSLVVALFVGAVSASILLSPAARKRPFNLYLVCLMVPDFVFSSNCAIVCYLSAAAGHFYSSALCKYQSWFLAFGIAGNAWITVAIVRELHTLLQANQRTLRYSAPDRKTVLKQAAAAYILSAFVASWGLLPASDKIPIRTSVQTGYACIPLEHDLGSSLFFFLIYFPLLSGIPMFYCTYVCIDVYRKNLLPPKGRRRRTMSLYYGRIVICLYVWWLPSIFFIFLYPNIDAWMKYGFSVWMHIQGLASAALMLGKPDIVLAVRQFFTCRCGQQKDSGSELFRSSWFRSSVMGLSPPARENDTHVPAKVAEQENEQTEESENIKDGGGVKESKDDARDAVGLDKSSTDSPVSRHNWEDGYANYIP